MISILTSGDVTFTNALMKLLLSFVAGGLIGLNREKQNQAAGFRTHVLIGMGSCLIMLISIYIPQEFINFKNGDPGRIAAQVITGIGFLGAGAIMRLGDHVKGITTAASIWISAAIGLAIGAGMAWIALTALVLVLITLSFLELLERFLFKKKTFKIVSIQIKQPKIDLDLIKNVLKHAKLKFEILEYRQNNYLGIFNVEVLITVQASFPLEAFMNKLAAIPNLQELSIRNKI